MTVARLLVLALLVLLPLEAAAARRYALVIGANVGPPGEVVLRFAERDAQRFADVLVKLGDVASEDLVLVLGPDAESLGRAFSALRARMRGIADAMVMVYYSGHADGEGLHLGATHYPFRDLRAAVRDLGAGLSVVIADACRSGSLTRKKGATPTAPFAFEAVDEVRAQGLVIITSSAADEDAQESDLLAGGIFTHHLIAGLLGAADLSGDASVSLSEAYNYARAQTVAATSASPVVQHPSYAFELEGERDVTLTRLAAAPGRGQLRLEKAGHYLVFQRGPQLHELVTELEARPGTLISLRPGRYLVRARTSESLFESDVDVRAGAAASLDRGTMARVPFRHAVRKGYGLRDRTVVSFVAAAEGVGPLVSGGGLMFGGALGVQLDVAGVALQGRVRFVGGAYESSYVATTQWALGFDAGVFHLLDVGRHGVGIGVRGGVDWVAQRFTTVGDAPGVDQPVLHFGPFARAELALAGWATFTIDVGADIYFMSQATPTDHWENTARAVPTVSLGFAFLL